MNIDVISRAMFTERQRLWTAQRLLLSLNLEEQST